jgi:hypothetical protein
MKNLTAPQRAVVLMHEALDVMLRVGQAPDSPVYAFVKKEERRQLLRDAKRLRKQQVEPRYKNLHSADELADLYERTARRVYLRIGLGEASWIGSFEIGHMSVGTISLMPDDKHLFVSVTRSASKDKGISNESRRR